MNELAIHLQMHSEKHLYEQIYEYIKCEIREGKLSCQDKLPSARSLAEFLQVSRGTVDLAYEQLVSEGYIEAIPCKGYYVCQIEGLYHIASKENASEMISVLPDKEYEYHFSPDGLDLSVFPFQIWRKISKGVLAADKSDLFRLGDSAGDAILRRTIAKYIHAARGVNCTPEQIIIGAGNEYLLMLLAKILGKEQTVAMENPTYKQAYKLFVREGYRVRLTEYESIHAGFLNRTDANLVYVMPAHQYPMGTVMPIGNRTKLLQWADMRENRYIIEDDYDSEFRYKGRPVPSLQSADVHGKVIYIGTFSKSIAPSIRISYMVLPDNLLKQYYETSGFLASTVSRIDQAILNEFMNGGYYERHLNKMRAIYKNKHDVLLTALKNKERYFRITGENAGLHILLHMKDRQEEELISLAEQAGIKVYGLSDSYIGTYMQREAVILLGYGAMDACRIREGAEKLLKVWEYN